jgi:hypothetical protein
MGRIANFCIAATAILCFSTALQAGGRTAADYPLRVHIFQHSGHSHYDYRQLSSDDGEGRANLYENGVPTAFDFSFSCTQRLMNSMGYETYLARWKKPGKSLDILFPVMGKPQTLASCEFKVQMKASVAYVPTQHGLREESSSVLQEWMVKRQYDPEHDKNQPVHPPSVTKDTDELLF